MLKNRVLLLLLCLLGLGGESLFAQDAAATGNPADVQNTGLPPTAEAPEVVTEPDPYNTGTNRPDFVLDPAVDEEEGVDYMYLDHADIVNVQEQEDTNYVEVHLYGNVLARLNANYIIAQEVTALLKNGSVVEVRASGNVQFTYGGSLYLAQSLTYEVDTERVVFYNVRSYDADMLGEDGSFYQAAKATLLTDPKRRLTMEDMYITTSKATPPHFKITAEKAWFMQDSLTLLANMNVQTGNASLLWLPVGFQVENGTGVESSFGNEYHIGFYWINTIKQSTPYGELRFGLDWYEQQGEYFLLTFTNTNDVGIFSKMNVMFEMANDTRTVENGDIYSSWVLNPETGEYETITQFGFHYSFDIAIETNDVSLRFFNERLNDPYFSEKYAYRERFDEKASVNWMSWFFVTGDKWFEYVGDESPSGPSSVQSGIEFSYKDFSASFNWTHTREANPDEANTYLNSAYNYNLTESSVGAMSYQPSDYTFLSKSLDTNESLQIITLGETNTYTMDEDPFQDFTEDQWAETTNITTNQVTNEYGTVIGQVETNTSRIPSVFYLLETNVVQLYNIQGRFGYSLEYTPRETFTSNTNDNSNEISRVVSSDNFSHRERAYATLDMSFWDGLFYFNNTLLTENDRQNTSIDAEKENLEMQSYYQLRWTMDTGVDYTYETNEGTMLQFEMPVSLKQQIDLPAFQYYERVEENYPTGSFDTSFNWGFNAFQDWLEADLLTFDVNVDFGLDMRFPYTDVPDEDIYYNDVIGETIGTGWEFGLWWASLGMSSTYNLLQTRDDEFEDGTYDDFTNRFTGKPTLQFDFRPPSTYEWVPSITYRYDVLEGKNLDFDLQSKIVLYNFIIPELYPAVDKVNEIGYLIHWYKDFEDARNNYLELILSIDFYITRYAVFKLAKTVRNDSLYLYYPEEAGYLAPGETQINVWEDLWNSLQFWNPEALAEGHFRITGFTASVLHDLDSWEMSVNFNLTRVVDDAMHIAFWEPSLGIQFVWKGVDGFSPTVEKSWAPPGYE